MCCVAVRVQWNADITNPVKTKSPLQQTPFFSPANVAVKCVEQNPGLMKSQIERYDCRLVILISILKNCGFEQQYSSFPFCSSKSLQVLIPG